jgi:hypothetical protein
MQVLKELAKTLPQDEKVEISDLMSGRGMTDFSYSSSEEELGDDSSLATLVEIVSDLVISDDDQANDSEGRLPSDDDEDSGSEDSWDDDQHSNPDDPRSADDDSTPDDPRPSDDDKSSSNCERYSRFSVSMGPYI